ncbi:hypothetical protein C5L29_000153 [Lactiplantibacillus pentosus]|nr:hypothetical protein C5L29_000153 [Lactiplantibacillus pentosus]
MRLFFCLSRDFAIYRIQVIILKIEMIVSIKCLRKDGSYE